MVVSIFKNVTGPGILACEGELLVLSDIGMNIISTFSSNTALNSTL